MENPQGRLRGGLFRSTRQSSQWRHFARLSIHLLKMAGLEAINFLLDGLFDNQDQIIPQNGDQPDVYFLLPLSRGSEFAAKSPARGSQPRPGRDA